MKIKILMVGGKRCGKTTTLASMTQQANDAFGGKMALTQSMQVIDSLNSAVAGLNAYFANVSSQSFFTPDDNPSAGIEKYNFSLNIIGKGKTGIEFEFTDIHGEAYQLGNPDNDSAKSLIEESNVLIIAIDTPYMMEDKDSFGYGAQHAARNKSIEITEFIKSKFRTDSKNNKLKEHLVLFVPLKCEHYYYQGRMAEVAETVKQAYAELITYFASPNLKDNCVLAITPILSVGGIEFHSFKYGYKIRKGGSYTPKYCEQPLLYTMTYYLKMLVNQNYKGDLFTKVKHFFVGATVTEADIKDAFSQVTPKLIKDKAEGYMILQDSLGI